MKELKFFYEDVKNHIKKSRFDHTLGVIKFAVELAKVYGENEKEAETAALFHDYCKYINNDEAINILKTSEFELNEILLNNPNLGHGFVASIIVKKKFDICNDNILNSIANHTFGRKGMSNLEKIIYLSDSLEYTRDYNGIEKLRKIAFLNLDEAVLKVSENTILYEMSKGRMIHPLTIEMRNEIIFNMEG